MSTLRIGEGRAVEYEELARALSHGCKAVCRTHYQLHLSHVTWMSHTCESHVWVTRLSHMYESCHMCESHVWVIPRAFNNGCETVCCTCSQDHLSRVNHVWAMAHTRKMPNVWVMSHLWVMSRAFIHRYKTFCFTYYQHHQRPVPRLKMSRVTAQLHAAKRAAEMGRFPDSSNFPIYSFLDLPHLPAHVFQKFWVEVWDGCFKGQNLKLARLMCACGYICMQEYDDTLLYVFNVHY